MFTCCVITFHKSTFAASSFTASDITLHSSCKPISWPSGLVHTKVFSVTNITINCFLCCIQHWPHCCTSYAYWARTGLISSKHLGSVDDLLHQMWQSYHLGLLQHKTALIIRLLLLRCFLQWTAGGSVYVLMALSWNMCKKTKSIQYTV